MGLYRDIIEPYIADLTTGLEALGNFNNALRDEGITVHVDPAARLAASHANAAMIMLNRVVFFDFSPDIAGQLESRTGGRVEPGQQITIAADDAVYDSDAVKIPAGTYTIAHLRDTPDRRQRITLSNNSTRECFVVYRGDTQPLARDERGR